tara:strand:- start:196 stop:1356 length:1161 start_codon:yes stop_codon:yes gene_type:complete
MISYGKQSIDQSDIDSVVNVLKGDWLTQGPSVEKFEADLKEYFNAKSACAVSSGTAALHLTGLALGWSKDDIIITTPITFLASVNSIIYSGAVPDFVDIDMTSFTIDLNKLEDKIKSYMEINKKVKAVIAVDYAGHPCDWEGLRNIADKYNIQLINDNCHALGAEYNGDKKYAVKYADVVIHSYHPVKHITTGEGGAILSNNNLLDEKVRLLRNHGMTKDSKKLINNDGPWYYEMHDVGYNYRITDIQCALGSNQLSKLDFFVQKRRDIAKIYNKDLSNILSIQTPKNNSQIGHAYHLYPLLIDFSQFSIDKVNFFNRLIKLGISLQVHYIPIHLQPYMKKKYGFKKGDFSLSEEFYKKEISLPIYPDLNNNELNFVIDSIIKILK